MSIGDDVWGRLPLERFAETGLPTDCPECLVLRSVLEDLCQVCYAELDELPAS